MFVTNQTTSGTFNFAPSGAELMLAAYNRCGIGATSLSQTQIFHARMALNFLLSEWSNIQPNLWEVDLQTMPLSQGVATYSVPTPTVMILDLYISIGTTPTIDRYMWPVSRTDYASYPNKTVQGPPTVFWYDRLISQTVTFYPVPDGNGPYIAKFYSVRQTQDADVINGNNVEVPYRFIDAYVSGLAWKLAEMFAPQLEDKLFARYQRALTIATTQDVENVPMYITPGIGGYFDQ